MFLNSLFLDYSYLELPLNKAEEGNNTGINISSNPSLLSRGTLRQKSYSQLSWNHTLRFGLNHLKFCTCLAICLNPVTNSSNSCSVHRKLIFCDSSSLASCILYSWSPSSLSALFWKQNIYNVACIKPYYCCINNNKYHLLKGEGKIVQRVNKGIFTNTEWCGNKSWIIIWKAHLLSKAFYIGQNSMGSNISLLAH